jgi:hypothetical protein
MRQALLLALILAAPAWAGVPVLTADEARQASAGEPVTRQEAGGWVVGIIDAAATPDEVIDALLDLDARCAEQRAARSVQVYARSADPEEVRARWVISVLGWETAFHLIYRVDRPQGVVTFGLDETLPNDVLAAEGDYRVYAQGSTTRLVYRTHSVPSASTPEWIRKRIAASSLVEQLRGIRLRAETHS